MTNLQYIDILLNSDLYDFNNVNNLFSMCRLIEKEDFKRAHSLNKIVKKQSGICCRTDKNGDPQTFENRKNFYRLNKLSYLFDAPYEFESFLIYMEWERTPEKRFYLPRRKTFKKLVDYLQDLEDDKYDLLSISMAPGTGKTTLGCFFLAWIMGKFPDACNLASAHGDKLTRGFFEQVLSIITDGEYLYKDIFPNIEVESTNSKDETINLGKPKRFKSLTCRSIGGGLTGSTRCEKYLYCDDLVSGIEEALNAERLDSLWSKYTNDLKSRKKKNCKEIHIATRWSIRDVIGRIQSANHENKRMKFISLPALNENDESNFDYDYSVGFDTCYLHDMRNVLDSVSWSCLYMNEPIEREGILFPEATLNYYDGKLPQGSPDGIYMFVDVAFGGGDYLSAPIGYKYGEKLYIHDVVFSKGNKIITKPLVVGKIMKNLPTAIRFEANNGGEEYGDDISKLIRSKTGIRINITSLKAPTTTSKMSRIIQVSPEIASCYYKDKKYRDKEYNDFMRNLTSFTTSTTNKNDDAPDSMAGLVNLAFKKYSGVEIIKRPI